MLHKYCFIILLICLSVHVSWGQIGAKTKVDDWKAVSVNQHLRGKWLLGAGPTFLGVTAKAGHFIANRTWLGVEGENHSFFSDRQEAGVFARYYLWNGGLLSGFSAVGVSYGRFQVWEWDFDNEYPSPPVYYSAKYSVAIGLEYALGRRMSFEGVGKLGKLTEADWVQPSLQWSVNLYLGK